LGIFGYKPNFNTKIFLGILGFKPNSVWVLNPTKPRQEMAGLPKLASIVKEQSPALAGWP